ncbi:hypothetical protein KIN20_027375 [Parelaphostrongylus tenuis]|uniref:Uncharacterized protein n=1 Tax=Parelaphostrongylus tenuis TaxID=148309 RepID=A0AAD5WDQ9_PARTN|nr:hypothetical protein KIN20_027375 [Parelaphostrongylus tenuis]
MMTLVKDGMHRREVTDQENSGLSPGSPGVPLNVEWLQRAPATLPPLPVACKNSPVGPPCSMDSLGVISFFRTFREEIRTIDSMSLCGALDIPRILISNGSRPSVVVEAHYVSSRPYFR